MRAAILLMLTIAITLAGGPASCQRENSRPSEVSEKGRPSPPSPQGNEEANSASAGDPFAAIPRIRVEELASAIKEGRAVVVDIRLAEDYDEERIKGAVSIPLEEIRERGPKELPADKLIVTYCA